MTSTSSSPAAATTPATTPAASYVPPSVASPMPPPARGAEDEPMPDRRLGLVVRDQRVYVDTVDLAGMLRARAQQYRTRAEDLVAQAADPGSRVEAGDRDVVTVVDESLACRMVAEELEQRADALDALG